MKNEVTIHRNRKELLVCPLLLIGISSLPLTPYLRMKTTLQRYLGIVLLLLFIGGCASQLENQITLMPAPDLFDQADWDPFTDRDPIKDIPYGGILYATDRKPSQEEGQYYLDERGHVLRLGVAEITIGKEGMTWEEARRITLLKSRGTDYPLKVTDVREIEILDRSVTALSGSLVDMSKQTLSDERFVDKVNAKLAISQVQDIFIYVHGYKVVFENPLLVASELWHFLGYEGVFISFSWPSTPDVLAYFSDLETAALSSRNLRLLIQYLAEETDVRRIHIIGYSAGTRVVTAALDQLALLYRESGRKDSSEALHLGHVILTASDVDAHIFGSYLMDGMLDVVEDLTIYTSSKDSALGMSNWVFGRERLGQAVGLSEDESNYLQQHDNLVIIDASDTPGADIGNGHAYFRQSPSTSSDILAMLRFDLKPGERGLAQENDLPIWKFPPDYTDRLRTAILKE